MRRLASLFLVLWLAFSVSPLLAQEHAEAEGGHGGGHAEGPSVWWKWLNFSILAGGLGYLVVTKGGPFFRSRALDIRKGIDDALEQSKQAEARAAGIDRRMANLAADIEALRTESRQELAAEAGRQRAETAAQLAKIQAHAEQEIASAAKSARQELRTLSAQLAIQLAERKVKDRMTPYADDALAQGFISDLSKAAR